MVPYATTVPLSVTIAPLPAITKLEGDRQYSQEVRSMGSAGVDFAVAFEAFVKWLSIMFGGGGGIGFS